MGLQSLLQHPNLTFTKRSFTESLTIRAQIIPYRREFNDLSEILVHFLTFQDIFGPFQDLSIPFRGPFRTRKSSTFQNHHKPFRLCHDLTGLYKVSGPFYSFPHVSAHLKSFLEQFKTFQEHVRLF